ncbi:PREDICTED: rho guanine nucleotide exchange factor 7-like isoform X1 [Branchiostoma belcheri]|uniref:Rho guanine nucleotide exchange factor 7-like isoform X1 n=2 Tax=Branchiostoma belcheri TaxID=7741 RepID=A0A6P4YH26_BRABE|nr:PREDICTED: rho guanine nucleotide exchange factor 7-like isoform X1 [Branchiostoma belcheri]
MLLDNVVSLRRSLVGVTGRVIAGLSVLCRQLKSQVRQKANSNGNGTAGSHVMQNVHKMADGRQMIVKARYAFQGTDEDELSFKKGDIITITQVVEGGWWEGVLNGRVGWFPSNYVKEVKNVPGVVPHHGDVRIRSGDQQKLIDVGPLSPTPKSPPAGTGRTAEQITVPAKTAESARMYHNLVLQNILETEKAHTDEMHTFLVTYLKPLQNAGILSNPECMMLCGNLEDVVNMQQALLKNLEDCAKLPGPQQRVGGCFLKVAGQMRALYQGYCANHPKAVSVLSRNNEELNRFMENQGAPSPGLMTLTTGLSQPFRRLDKYPTLLKELDRHLEEGHPDRYDVQQAIPVYKNIANECLETRKQKEIEFEIMNSEIKGWEGEEISQLGEVILMSMVTVHTGDEEKKERYFLLFPGVLLMLSISPRMSGFIYEGKLALSGLNISRLEDVDNIKNAFEISGSLIERIVVTTNSTREQAEWATLLQQQTKISPVTPVTSKPPPVPASSRTPTSTLQRHQVPPAIKDTVLYIHETSMPPSGKVPPAKQPDVSRLKPTSPPPASVKMQKLEPPPRQPGPWTLSCLRPAPPLRPSAALLMKESRNSGNKTWSVGCLPPDMFKGPAAALLTASGHPKQDPNRSPRTVRRLLTSSMRRKQDRAKLEEEYPPVRLSSAQLEEDAAVLRVIEAYCTSTSKMRQQSLLSTSSRQGRLEQAPQVLVPEEEKIIVEETKNNQTVVQEKSLVDTVYQLKDQVEELCKETKRLNKGLEEEVMARKRMESIIRKSIKSLAETNFDETNL